MILIREILFDAAREIVEGRRKLPTVSTVPVVEFRAPPAPVEQPEPTLRLADLREFNLIARQP